MVLPTGMRGVSGRLVRGMRLERLGVRAAVALRAFVTVIALGLLSSWTADAAMDSSRGDPLIHTARLVASDGSVDFGSAAMSGGVLAAGAPFATVGSNQSQGAVYLFNEPRGGWSDGTQAAKLVASDGTANDDFGISAAISGDTVVVESGSASGSSNTLYVFTKPPGGWSGTVHESARLTASDLPSRDGLVSVAMSGNTIVAGSTGPGAGAAYVFTEPGSGWSGTIHESAKLTAPDTSNSCSPFLTTVAIDGPTVVAGGPVCSPGTAYVFTEPASGWSGTIQQSAELIAPSAIGSVAITGSSVVAAGGGPGATDPVVFNEPRGGWSGVIHPAATLKVSLGSVAAPPIELVTASGDTIAMLLLPNNDTGCGFEACDGFLYAFSRPPAGWSGTIAGPSTTVGAPAGPFPLAAEGHTVVAGGYQGRIDIFTSIPGPPTVRNVSLSGLAAGKPKLHFILDAGQGAAPIRSIKLSLPSGLRFARHGPGRTRGVLINGGPVRVARLSPGSITVVLTHPGETVSVTIAHPAIVERQSLVTQLRRAREYNRTHRRKRALTVNIRGVVTDTTNHSTRITLKTKLS
jgi:hypothetical protein